MPSYLMCVKIYLIEFVIVCYNTACLYIFCSTLIVSVYLHHLHLKKRILEIFYYCVTIYTECFFYL